MNLQQIIDHLELKPLTQTQDFSQVEPKSGYTADLLSCVMAGAKAHCIWVTLQAHVNIIAVAALLDMSAIIITEGAQPDQATITKANAQSIPVLSTPRSTFDIVGELWSLGLRSIETA
jgi:hypothetical protein